MFKSIYILSQNINVFAVFRILATFELFSAFLL